MILSWKCFTFLISCLMEAVELYLYILVGAEHYKLHFKCDIYNIWFLLKTSTSPFKEVGIDMKNIQPGIYKIGLIKNVPLLISSINCATINGWGWRVSQELIRLVTNHGISPVNFQSFDLRLPSTLSSLSHTPHHKK